MTALETPEWRGPFATGLFGTAYALGGGRSLVLVGAPDAVVGARPERKWFWVVMSGRPWSWTRDFVFEEQLRADKDLAELAGVQAIDGDRLFTTAERDLGAVLRVVSQAVR